MHAWMSDSLTLNYVNSIVKFVCGHVFYAIKSNRIRFAISLLNSCGSDKSMGKHINTMPIENINCKRCLLITAAAAAAISEKMRAGLVDSEPNNEANLNGNCDGFVNRSYVE